MNNGDMPVTPLVNEHGCPYHHSAVGFREGAVTGLTKREYFAAMAMQGFLSNKGHATYFNPEHDAEYVLRIADALLEALERAP
ncbi:hypothetical protein [Stenotrophomonas sp.]|uniref:hypothetical protein n=1 Tax=Stenotrophomonas sp. TaxID=69392 RepID=UPI002898EEE3|nr:hypothetical protein [Stenotrophomonas sp.]